jgi:hypothetical protein
VGGSDLSRVPIPSSQMHCSERQEQTWQYCTFMLTQVMARLIAAEPHPGFGVSCTKQQSEPWAHPTETTLPWQEVCAFFTQVPWKPLKEQLCPLATGVGAGTGCSEFDAGVALPWQQILPGHCSKRRSKRDRAMCISSAQYDAVAYRPAYSRPFLLFRVQIK